MNRRLLFPVPVLAGLMLCLWGGVAQAAPPQNGGASAGGSVDTSKGTSGSSSGRNSGYDWPEFVMGGNAIQVQVPFQVGLVAYQPKVRLGIQYDRQLYKPSWVHIGAAALLDRGNWRTFRMDDCGIAADGACEPGTVAGLDVYAGYTHKFFVKKRPFLVPYLHASLGGGFWKLPKVTGGRSRREQERVLSWYLNLRLGGGLRVFLMRDLAVGFDLSIDPGFVIHRIDEEGSAADNTNNDAQFFLGLEILPAFEYRF